MGRSIRVLSLSLGLALAAGMAVAAAGSLTVEINDSQRIGLYGAAANVIVGDPNVADVSMLDTRSVIVTGKGYGSTHVMVFDGTGRTLLDRRVVVVAPREGHVTLYKGAVAADYSCTPRCQAAASASSSASASSASSAASSGPVSGAPSTTP